VNIIVENHGGLSSDGVWMAGLMRLANDPRVGTLPDFGNFRVADGVEYDRYQGIRDMMPFAKGVSAKSYGFDSQGNETTIDYPLAMAIVVEFGYHGFVGIEFEGDGVSEDQGIRSTLALLERIRASMSRG
jgi:sugar phosphate isomerase/epimerase